MILLTISRCEGGGAARGEARSSPSRTLGGVQPNPYAAPAAPTLSAKATVRSAARIGTLAVVAAAVHVCLWWCECALDALARHEFEHDHERVHMYVPSSAFVWTGMLTLSARVAAVALFLVWIHRAASNVHERGRSGMTVSPFGAVGWFFVPVANLFMPYRAMSGLARASSARGAEPLWVLLWWVPLVASNLLVAWMTSAWKTADTDSFEQREALASTLASWSVLAAALATVAAVALFFVVRFVTGEQARWIDKKPKQRRKRAG